METGDWGSNKQLAWYPLTVAGKVAMLRFAERERWKGKNEMEGHRMLSAGKKFHLGMQTLPHSKHSNHLPKFVRVLHSNTPYLKVVGISP